MPQGTLRWDHRFVQRIHLVYLVHSNFVQLKPPCAVFGFPNGRVRLGVR